MRKRRHKKRRPVPYEKSNIIMKFVPALVIIILAIALGYGTARFVVGPLCGYDLADLKINIKESEPKAEPKPETKTETKPETEQAEGYALQFGCFTTKEKASSLRDRLSEYGINTSIKKTEDGYKVIGETLKSKEEALNELNNIDKTKDIDVFITKITKGE